MNTDTEYRVHQMPVINRAIVRPKTKTRPSRGGIDEINPEDIIYGEYSNDDTHGEYLDLIYLEDDILRTLSGSLIRPDDTFDELVTLLRDDEKYFVIEISEVKYGFAFKRTNIVDITVTSVIAPKTQPPPSCTWTIKFEDGSRRGVETNYQSYFTYGRTERPRSMTNQYIINKMLPKQ